jgi:Uma2 family endonuclease
LVIEIADTSLERDRILKQRIYAAVGIPCYWILDLAGRRLEVCLDPREGAYSRVDIYRAGDAVPVFLDGLEAGSIAVESLLP